MKYIIILISTITLSAYFSRGCCSNHGGIDYCGNNGYYICNDGTRSPSCTCFDEDKDNYIITGTNEPEQNNIAEENSKTNDKKDETTILEYIGLAFVGIMVLGSIYCNLTGKKSNIWYG